MRAKKVLKLMKQIEEEKIKEESMLKLAKLGKPPPPPKKKVVYETKPSKELKEREPKKEVVIKSKDILKPKDFKTGWKRRLKDKFRPSKTMLIEMTHMNGTCSHFFLITKVHKFNLSDRSYIVDEERKIYSNTSKIYMLRYHEGFAMPYDVNITSVEMKKALESQSEEIQEIKTSYNPSLLKDVLKFEYAKGVIQGAEVHEFIKRSLLIGIVTLIAVLIHLAIAAYKGGWI